MYFNLYVFKIRIYALSCKCDIGISRVGNSALLCNELALNTFLIDPIVQFIHVPIYKIQLISPGKRELFHCGIVYALQNG